MISSGPPYFVRARGQFDPTIPPPLGGTVPNYTDQKQYFQNAYLENLVNRCITSFLQRTFFTCR